VAQVLAQLARALQATHEASAVHRDVKGENVLVRRADGRAMLTDFGAGHYHGAARLTWQPQPPGTPAYQSPESALFQFLSAHSRDAHYVAGPGDDVFALGVTAYRLLTGMYPPPPLPQRDKEGRGRMMPLYLPPPHQLNRRVEPQLSALILRMLSLKREERGSAGELAEALEAAAGGAEPEVEAPAGVPVRERPRARPLAWRSKRVLAGVGVCLALGLGLRVYVRGQGVALRERLAVGPGRHDEGPVGLGGSVSEAKVAPMQEPSEQEAIGQEPLPELRPGQLRPDARGQCPGRTQVAINGGCWLEVLTSGAEECEQSGYVLIKSRCYAPALETRRRKPPPTSDSPQ
jgi:eukaryotic-like serine/threonine-protein kinase